FDQSLQATLTPLLKADDHHEDGAFSRLYGAVMNEAGQMLEAVTVKITDPLDSSFVQKITQTGTANNAGLYDTGSNPPLASTTSGQYEIQVSFLTLEGACRLKNVEENRDLEVDLTFNVVGLDPEKAFADGTKLDVTKPFFPFGQQPQPGSTFYVKQDEVFGKPGAKVQIYVARTTSPQDLLDVKTIPPPDPIPIGAPVGDSAAAMILPSAAAALDDDKKPLDHLISWEYWDGRRWVAMFQSSPKPKTPPAPGEVPKPVRDLDVTEIIEFEVPPDLEVTTVNDEEGRWIRARLVSGGFGFTEKVSWRDDRLQKNNQLTYVVNKPPSLAAIRIGYTWQSALIAPEHVQTYNDFQYEDETYASVWPGNAFLPFKRVKDVTPSLYLGLTKKLPTDSIGIYFDIVEQGGETRGPAMVWEYFDGFSWRELSAEDETRNLRLPGILSFIAAEDSQPLARFGEELHWLRGRLKEDGPPGEPTVNGLFVNAAWVSQRQTFTDVPLGTSTGLPNQVFRFTQIPVLAGERVEVREIAGPRANVEWRILAMEISGGSPDIIREFEEMLGGEGAQVDFVKGDLRLRRDRQKRVVEVWVRWKEQPHLFYSGPEDRHYVIDRARGLLFFGDGTSGKIPPPGAQVLSRRHQSGGGLAGNVAARAIKQSLTPIPGVQTVFNPRAAEGGADGETVETFARRGPQSVRHRGRAIAPSDYETLAYEASPAVAVARALSTRNTSGRALPGWVTLIIIPQSKERRPWPSFGLREQVRKFLEDRAPADVVAADQIYVTGPNYFPVDVEATIAPRNASEAGQVERRAREALEEFLHPLRGGPERKGWELGRDIYLSDVASVLERVEGVDYVSEFALLKSGVPAGEQVTVADDRIVVAGEIRLKLEAAER
ncbi:MAG TPA: putative baseplate assembly protein, partial [Blastocatellia bacterium]|nr:putative baseplate assembly protein [Blastocatellia bacterium]